jgi:protocatechuate 3,4-dioxygenase beta subunit
MKERAVNKMEKAAFVAYLTGGVIVAAAVVFFLFGGSDEGDLSQSGVGTGETAGADPTATHSDGNDPLGEGDPLGDDEAKRIVLAGSGQTGDSKAGAAPSAAGVITGRVVSEFGAPLAEAEIRRTAGTLSAITVKLEVNGASGKPVKAGEETCRSGGDGLFRLEGVEEAESLNLRVSHSGFIPRNLSVKTFDGTSRDVGDVVLELGGSIAGTVTDSAGALLAGATVTAAPVDSEGGSSFLSLTSFLSIVSGWKAVTGEDGSYRIDGIPAGKVNVSARHSSHPSAVVDKVAVAKGEETSGVDIVLPRGYSISGRVVKADGEPVEYATITVDPTISFDFENLESLSVNLDDTLKPAVTDDAGCFTLKGLEEGEYTLQVSASTYLSSRKEGVATGTDNLVVLLEKGGWLAGSVVDGRTGEGIEEFTLDVGGTDDGAKEITLLTGAEAVARMGGTVDEAGAFFIEGLGRSPWGFTVCAEGYGEERFSDLTSVPGRGRFMDVELFEESVITGILLSSRGEPVPDGTIRLKTVGAGEKSSRSRSEAKVKITATRSDGTPVPADMLNSGEKSTAGTAKSLEDGSFEVKGVGRGSYLLEAEHEKHTDAEPHPLTVKRGEMIEGITLRLGSAGSIAGVAYGTDGKPMPGATVNVSRGGGLTAMIASGAMGGQPDFDMENVSTESDGRYRVDGLAPGRYRIRLIAGYDEGDLSGLLEMSLSSIAGGDAPGTIKTVVRDGEVTEVDLYDTMKGALIGRVTASGSPVSSLRVGLYRTGLLAIMPIKTTSTDNGGNYRFEGLEEGAYNIRVNLPGQKEELEEPADLDAGARLAVDFTLPGGAIVGRVVDASTGDPLSGIEVSIVPAGGVKKRGFFDSLGIGVKTTKAGGTETGGDDDVPFDFGGAKPTRTDGDGRFAIRHIADGEYTVSARGKGYVGSTLQAVAVVEGRETGNADIALSPGGRVSGRVIHDATGKSAGFCMVTCVRADSEGSEKEKSVLSGNDGSFSFDGLAPGRYRLSADGSGSGGTLEVELAGAEKKGLEIRIE